MRARTDERRRCRPPDAERRGRGPLRLTGGAGWQRFGGNCLRLTGGACGQRHSGTEAASTRARRAALAGPCAREGERNRKVDRPADVRGPLEPLRGGVGLGCSPGAAGLRPTRAGAELGRRSGPGREGRGDAAAAGP